MPAPPLIPPPPVTGVPRPAPPLVTPPQPQEAQAGNDAAWLREAEEPDERAKAAEPETPDAEGTEAETAQAEAAPTEPAAKPAWLTGMPRPQRLRANVFDEQPTLPISPPQEAPPEAPAAQAPPPRRVSPDDTDALIADVASELIAFGEAQQREREAAEAREQQKSATATGEFVTQDPVVVAVPLRPKGLPFQGQAKWFVATVVGVAALVTVLVFWLWPAQEEAPESSDTVAQARPAPEPEVVKPTPVVAPVATAAATGDGNTDDGATGTAATGTGAGSGAAEATATDQDATDAALAGDAAETKKPKKPTKRRRSRSSSDKRAPAPKKEDPAKKQPETTKKSSPKPSSAESRVIAACKRGDKNAAKAALKEIPLFQRRPVKKRCKELGVKL